MRMHITDKGPERCRKDPAKDSVCPFVTNDEDHFPTKTAAVAEWDRRQAIANENKKVNSLSAKLDRQSKEEAEIRDKHAGMAQKLVEARADGITGITYDDADTDRAKTRLKQAIDFARERENEWLIEKLSESSVLPSGAFKLSDGSRANVDQMIKAKTAINHVESQREQYLGLLTKELRTALENGEELQKIASVKTRDGGSISMTVREGFDESEFDKLPKELQAKLSSPKQSLNIDLAREHLSPAELRDVSSETQVLDFVMGKEKEVGQETLQIAEPTGNNINEKLANGLTNIAGFYSDSNAENGTVKQLKAQVDESSSAIKTVASKNPKNTFVPARSMKNGALVTGRRNLNAKLVKEKLTEDQIKKISVTKDAPDAAKAASILTPEMFAKVFKAKKVSITVREAK